MATLKISDLSVGDWVMVEWPDGERWRGIPYRAIYKNTTIDPPGTVQHCKDNNVEVVMPKERFFDIIARKGLPTRRARFCCEVLKEYKILDNAVQGIRRSESTKRAKNYAENEPIICRNYSKSVVARCC